MSWWTWDNGGRTVSVTDQHIAWGGDAAQQANEACQQSHSDLLLNGLSNVPAGFQTIPPETLQQLTQAVQARVGATGGASPGAPSAPAAPSGATPSAPAQPPAAAGGAPNAAAGGTAAFARSPQGFAGPAGPNAALGAAPTELDMRSMPVAAAAATGVTAPAQASSQPTPSSPQSPTGSPPPTPPAAPAQAPPPSAGDNVELRIVQLHRTGQRDQAVALYRQTFGGTPMLAREEIGFLLHKYPEA